MDSLDQLKKHGVYRVRREYIEEQFEDIAEYYISLYTWFTQKAAQIVPKPADVEFPVWCSISEDYMLRPIEDTVVYVLEIPKKETLYFDSVKWDWVLNHLYIPKDGEDLIRYREQLKQKGFKDAHSFIDGKYASSYPLERKEVMDSWMRVFNIEEWNPFRVQANIWEIKEEQIREIIPYK